MKNAQIQISLKALRVNKNLKQEDAAKELGVTARTIANWENGKTFPNLKHLRALEKLYGISFTSIKI